MPLWKAYLRLSLGGAQLACAIGAVYAVVTGAPSQALAGWAVAAVLAGTVSVALFGGFWRR